MRMLVLGAGGIGGYVGGRLAAGGADISFLVRPGRGELLATEGLRITSPLGDLQIPVKTLIAPEVRPGYDFVLLTCKAYDLESAMDAIAPAIDGRCAIVPMLNGMAHLDTLKNRFGESSVMGGTCLIDVTLDRGGVVRHAGSLQKVIFGERDRLVSARAKSLAEAFASAQIEWELSEDIVLSMWEKIVFLSVLAAATCLFRANVREIISSPGGLEVMEGALAINIEIARREGYAIQWGSPSKPEDRPA